ncbi:MAG TPA: class IV adenylate cyclase, partial [Anaerolineales bacterium]|nr:class IV adenylate cyclase [Anaerolineales bacterium]
MQETEVKFYVRDLSRLKAHLEKLGARPIQERVLETNIRFDLPDARLRAEGRVLRLRQDTATRLTYKGASKKEEGILSREEIEFVVEDFEKAKQFLEALGYQKLVYYEKYRTTYDLHDTHIMLDELPYGNFIEIEGKTFDSIRLTADQLGLKWETAVGTSYLALFERARKALKFSFPDLSFANFTGTNVAAAHLEVSAADGET